MQKAQRPTTQPATVHCHAKRKALVLCRYEVVLEALV